MIKPPSNLEGVTPPALAKPLVWHRHLITLNITSMSVALRGGCNPGGAHNLNVGCPSGRVQSGRFGACLMAEPERVAECVAAMQEAAQAKPVSVKCRIFSLNSRMI